MWLGYGCEVTAWVDSLAAACYGSHESGEFLYDFLLGGVTFKWFQVSAFGECGYNATAGFGGVLDRVSGFVLVLKARSWVSVFLGVPGCSWSFFCFLPLGFPA